MRLLVTGASGFIGRNLMLKLPKEWDVFATYNKSADFVKFVEENRLNKVEPVKVDLTHLHEIKEKISGKFDCGVHLVANTNAILSVKNPVVDLQMNVVTLLNTVKATKISRLIYISSGAVYGGHVGKVSSDVHLRPTFPYAVSKLACEHYVRSCKRYKMIDDYVILRLFGVYGPYEPPRKIFTKLVKAFYIQDKKEFTIIGDGNNYIDAMYADDAAESIVSVIRASDRNLTANFSTGSPLTVNELALKVAEIVGKENVKLKHKDWPVEYTTFYASSEEIEALCGFKPSTPLRVGIWKLAKWLEKKSA